MSIIDLDFDTLSGMTPLRNVTPGRTFFMRRPVAMRSTSRIAPVPSVPAQTITEYARPATSCSHG